MPAMPYNQLPQYGNDQLTGYLGDVLGGKYLDAENPHLQGVIDRTTRDVNAGFDQQRANLARNSLAPGRMGSTAWTSAMQGQQGQFAQGLADALSSLRYGNYARERGAQDTAAGLSQARDSSIWGDLTNRKGIDTQAETARAASAAASASAARAAQVQEQVAKNNYLLGMAGLGENARQFDATMPLQWGGLASNLLGTLGSQDLASMGLTSDMIGTQMGNQLGAAGLGMQGDQSLLGSQLSGVGMIPGLEQSDLGALGLAGDYLSSLYQTDAGLQAAKAAAGASRYATSTQDQLARDQLQYGSVQNQFGAGDPMAAFSQYLAQLGGIGGLAGGTSSTEGVQPGQVIDPGQGSFMGGLQRGLGGAMSGLGLVMQGGWGPFGGRGAV